MPPDPLLKLPPLLTESAVGTAPPPPRPDAEEVTFTLDGREVTAKAGELLITAAEEQGVYIPRFCYHPRMKPVGMCRMCLVEVSGPRGPSLMPACYNTVSAGMEVNTRSPMAKKAQEGVLEFLLVNHPLDCPVCDKGGECPLQDQTLSWGPGESRFVEEKRHWEKPIPISELVYLDRERCIQCGRCVRFADEVAGDPLIDFVDRSDRTEVATYPEQPYTSYFSGNVVQICPVGALTSRLYRFKARPWDLDQVESTCTACSFGCRVAVQSSQGELTRLIGVDSDPVNWAWLCDKGRYGFLASAAPGRLKTPLVRKGGQLVEAGWAEALAAAADGIGGAKAAGGGESVAVIGGSRLCNEDAYAWSKAARLALGTDNVDAQLGDGLPAETVLGLPRATIDDACSAPLVITLTGDVKEELPVLYLRLRDAVRESGVQLVELTPAPTGLSPYAAITALYRPGEAAALAAAVAGSGEVTGAVAGVERETIEQVRAHIERAGQRASASDAGSASGSAPSAVVILGRPSLTEAEEQVAAAARLLADIPGVRFLTALRRSNVFGALDMGLAPGVLPGRLGLDAAREWYEHHWGAPLPANRGMSTAAILDSAARGHIGGLVLLGADPRVDFPDAVAALKGLSGARFVVAVDTHLSESSLNADVVLPAAAWAERRGTFTNIEGRITWLAQKVAPAGMSWPDWMIAAELSRHLGIDLGFSSLEEIWDEVSTVSPLHRGVTHEELSAEESRDGVVVPASDRPARPPRPLDPMADPGISSAELHSIESSAIVFEPNPETSQSTAPTTDGPGSDDPVPMPPMLGLPMVAPPDGSGAPPTNTGAGVVRLVSRRILWDAGSGVQSVPLLAGLVPEPCLQVHPSVLADLGVADGEEVLVTSSRDSLVVQAAGDPGLSPGTATLPWNLPTLQAGRLIDGGARATTVTIEASIVPGVGEVGGGDES